ncbi:MAG: sarcosine oxidase subunit delta [Pseudomonadota bacterium]
MQLFRCPFCGLRNETEFLFAVEAGHPRPEPAESVSDEEWARYLYLHKAPKGHAREIWLHVTCGEYFVLDRNTITREVLSSEALPGIET